MSDLERCLPCKFCFELVAASNRITINQEILLKYKEATGIEVK